MLRLRRMNRWCWFQELSECDHGGRVLADDTGIVDKIVEATVSLFNKIHRRLNGGIVGHVKLERSQSSFEVVLLEGSDCIFTAREGAAAEEDMVGGIGKTKIFGSFKADTLIDACKRKVRLEAESWMRYGEATDLPVIRQVV